MGLPSWLSGKESSCQGRILRKHKFNSWVGKIPWRRKWQPIPVFLPGKFHGQRRLEGWSSWGLKELDTAELLSRHGNEPTKATCIGSCRTSLTQLLSPQLTPKQGHHKQGHHKQGHRSSQFFMAPFLNLKNRHIWLCRQTWMWLPQSLTVFTPLCDALFFSMSGIWEFIISNSVDKSDTVYVIMFHKSIIPTFQKDALPGWLWGNRQPCWKGAHRMDDLQLTATKKLKPLV